MAAFRPAGTERGQALEDLGRGNLDPRIDEDRGERCDRRPGRYALAKSAHPRRAVIEADRHIGANGRGLRDKARRAGRVAICPEQNPDRGRRVRGAAAEARRDGDVLCQAEIAQDFAAKPARHRALGLENEVFAIDGAGEGAFEAEAVLRRGREAQFVAKVREYDQAIQLVIAVGPLSQHMEGEIDLGASLLADGGGTGNIGYRGRMSYN